MPAMVVALMSSLRAFLNVLLRVLREPPEAAVAAEVVGSAVVLIAGGCFRVYRVSTDGTVRHGEAPPRQLTVYKLKRLTVASQTVGLAST